MPDTIPQLKQEIATIEAALVALDTELRSHMAAEDPAAGIFRAAEIHNLRQEKMVLLTRREFRAVRIRRIKYMEAEENF